MPSMLVTIANAKLHDKAMQNQSIKVKVYWPMFQMNPNVSLSHRYTLPYLYYSPAWVQMQAALTINFVSALSVYYNYFTACTRGI
jgi:hypothetical protein